MSRRQMLGLAAVAVAVGAAAWRLLGGGAEGDQEVAPDVPVHVAAIGRATLHRYVTAYGTVEPEPSMGGRSAAGALITPFADGVLASVEVAEGQRVEAGAVLFRLDSRMAQVEVTRARAELDFAEQAFQRQERLLATDGTSQRAYQESVQQRDVARSALAAAETALAYLNIEAPLGGTVTEITARVGQRVDANSTLARVVDLTRLVVGVRVPQRDFGGVGVGQQVLLGPDGTVEGQVRLLGREADPTDGTYRVVVSLPAGAGFMPGQFTEARISVEEHADVLAVPEVGVVSRTEEGSWIVVVDGEQAVRRAVTVGLRDAGLVEVRADGLEEGMRVVTEEAYGLPEETRITVVGG